MTQEQSFKFHKVCLCCRKQFGSNSRNTRFCSPECQKKYQSSRTKRRKEYQENKEEALIWVMAHTLSRRVCDDEVRKGLRVKKCVRCDMTEGLEVHHVDGNHLNCSGVNLVYCCKTHHAELDSERKKGVV